MGKLHSPPPQVPMLYHVPLLSKVTDNGGRMIFFSYPTKVG